MANVKTAISLQRSLFEQIEALARELRLSRSRLFALAAEDFLHRQQNQHLLEKINAAYQDVPIQSEQTLQRRMRRRHKRIVENEW